jgi:hypothetical protein
VVSKTPALLRVRFDWDNNLFENEYSDVSRDLIDLSYNLGINDPDGHMASEGVATIKLKDPDQLYFPDSPTSPLLGKVKVGVVVWVEAWDPRLPDWTIVWSGYVKSIDPLFDKGYPVVNVNVQQDIRTQQDTFVWDVHTNIGSGELIRTLLRENGWSTPVSFPAFTIGVSALDSDSLDGVNTDLYFIVGVDSLDGDKGFPGFSLDNPERFVSAGVEDGLMEFTYAGADWKEDKRGLYNALKQIAEAERGYFWIDEQGQPIFRGMDYYSKYTTPVFSLDVGDDFRRAQYKYGESPVTAQVNVTYAPLVLDNNAIVYDNTGAFGKEVKVNGDSDREITLKYGDGGDDKVTLLELAPINSRDFDGSWERVWNFAEETAFWALTTLDNTDPLEDDPDTENENEVWPILGRHEIGRGFVQTNIVTYRYVSPTLHSDYRRGVAVKLESPYAANITEIDIEYVLFSDDDNVEVGDQGIEVYGSSGLLYSSTTSQRDRVQRVTIVPDTSQTELWISLVCDDDVGAVAQALSGRAEIRSIRLKGIGDTPFEQSFLSIVSEEDGSDLTDQVDWSIEANAKSAVLRVTNPFEHDIILYLTLRGKAVIKGESVEIYDYSETAAQAIGKILQTELENPLWSSELQAKQVILHDLTWRSAQIGYVAELTMLSRDVEWYQRQLDIKLGDLISLTHRGYGIEDRLHMVKAISSKYTGALKTTLTLQPIPQNGLSFIGFMALDDPQSRLMDFDYELLAGQFD